MRHLLLGATALATIAFAGTASAADLPRRAAPPIFTPIPVFTWTGFYAGFNAGYGFGIQDDTAATYIAAPASTGLFVNGGVPVEGAIAFSNRSASEGFVGGGQIGYNYQFTPGTGIVVGVEADAQYVDFGRNRGDFAFLTVPAGGTPNPGVTFVNPNGLSSLDFFGTVRGRIGVAFDRALFYGTGGFAYGTGSNNNFDGVSEDDFRTGYAVGGGVEYALPTDSFLNFFKSSAVTFKVEALYVNLERNNSTNGFFGYVGGTPVASVFDPRIVSVGYVNRREDEFVVVRGGVNYKFGSY